MIEAVYFGTLIPLLFLIVVIKGEYRRLILFFAWGLTSAILVYLINILLDTHLLLEQTFFLTQLIPAVEELIKVFPLLFLLKSSKRTSQFSIVRLAMAAGIGLSILENYLYLSMTSSSGMANSIFFIITRSLTACVLHGSLTALIGWAIQVMRNRRFFSLGFLLGMYLLAVSIHSLYNALGLLENLRVVGILIPLFLFTAEYYFFNFYGRKIVRKTGPGRKNGEGS